MKRITYIIILVLVIISCKSNYSLKKTNIDLDAYTNSKYKNGIIISALNKENNFYSLFYAEIKDKSYFKKLIKFNLKNREDFHNISNGIYLPISNEFYFTSNNKKSGNLELYKCEIDNFNLLNPTLVNLELEKFSYGHSTFFTNGLNMIIASKESEKIKLKLYTRPSFEENWIFKRNLDELNTGKYNYHPILINDTKIVYSQKNKNKIDLYFSLLNESNYWSTPQKIKNLIDSREKINYVLTTENTGYFTSKKTKKNKSEEIDEIYYFELKK
ncbi:hypothetical protein [Tenacibaculum holothuriorum]|nr:hypothetical protein [Tenacibaculum holothuriorum]